MISTVAVGTDGSRTASIALEAAIELAERYAAGLVVLSACGTGPRRDGVRPTGPTTEEYTWEATEATQVERVLAAAEEAAAARGVECRTAMERGEPGDVLVKLAAEHRADLLVVGTQGLHRRVLGSVPNSVSHRAGCSVLLVKTS